MYYALVEEIQRLGELTGRTFSLRLLRAGVMGLPQNAQWGLNLEGLK